MKNSISPYPENVKIKGDQVFLNGKYLGYVDHVQNWGKDFLARPEGKENKFFSAKTLAVLYIVAL